MTQYNRTCRPFRGVSQIRLLLLLTMSLTPIAQSAGVFNIRDYGAADPLVLNGVKKLEVHE